MTSTTNYKFQNNRGRYILMFIVFEVTLAVFALLAPMKAKRENKQVLNFVYGLLQYITRNFTILYPFLSLWQNIIIC